MLIRIMVKQNFYLLDELRYGFLKDIGAKFQFLSKIFKIVFLTISMLLNEMSRLVPKLVRLDDFEQSYNKVNFVIKNISCCDL